MMKIMLSLLLVAGQLKAGYQSQVEHFKNLKVPMEDIPMKVEPVKSIEDEIMEIFQQGTWTKNQFCQVYQDHELGCLALAVARNQIFARNGYAYSKDSFLYDYLQEDMSKQKRNLTAKESTKASQYLKTERRLRCPQYWWYWKEKKRFKGVNQNEN